MKEVLNPHIGAPADAVSVLAIVNSIGNRAFLVLQVPLMTSE
jgi:hypothetical protein